MKAATPTLTAAMTNLVDTREVRASECFSQALLRVHQCLGGVSSEAELRAALAGPVAQLVPHRRFFGALLKRRPDGVDIVYGVATTNGARSLEWRGRIAPDCLRLKFELWLDAPAPLHYLISTASLPNYLNPERMSVSTEQFAVLACGTAPLPNGNVPFGVFAGEDVSIEHAHAAELIMPSLALMLQRLEHTSSTHSRTRLALTLREREVLCWLLNGKSNADIGVLLDIKVHTVKFHLKRLYEKLGVFTRQQAIVKAHAVGLADSVAMAPPDRSETHRISRPSL